MTVHEKIPRIEYLADHPALLPKVALWQQREFAHLGATPLTLEQRIERLGLAMQKGRLPMSMVTLSPEGKLLGSASVLAATLTHQHLTPWLSTVVVAPENRGKGIGSALSLRAASEAAAMGFDTLHLFTPNGESLYARLGWQTFDHLVINGLKVAVMAKSLSLEASGATDLINAGSPYVPENSAQAAAKP